MIINTHLSSTLKVSCLVRLSKITFLSTCTTRVNHSNSTSRITTYSYNSVLIPPPMGHHRLVVRMCNCSKSIIMLAVQRHHRVIWGRKMFTWSARETLAKTISNLILPKLTKGKRALPQCHLATSKMTRCSSPFIINARVGLKILFSICLNNRCR